MKLKAKLKWKGKVKYENQYYLSCGLHLSISAGQRVLLQDNVVEGPAASYVRGVYYPIGYYFAIKDVFGRELYCVCKIQLINQN